MTTQPPQGLPLGQYLQGQVAQPTLPAGTQFTPTLLPTDEATLQATGQLQDVNAPGVQMAPTGSNITPTAITSPTLNAAQGIASTADTNAPLSQITPGNLNYQAATVDTNNAATQGTAEQGTVDPLSTVQGQLAKLYAETQVGMTPEWAQGAVRQAEEAMAARGMGSSSIGAAAITEAVQQSALPIAAQDASTYFQMDLTNLNNRQQMTLENLKNRQQGFLSNQAAENAARQFNASSQSQIQQFMASLVSSINNQNADRTQAMELFNVGQSNQIDITQAANDINIQTFNAQQEAALKQFNESQNFAREQFNSQAAFAIQQSNVLWRRNINTENTAAINAANQTNVQNAFNISQVAQDQLWQRWRDESSWIFQASENEKNRQYNVAQAANNNAYQRAQSKSGGSLGALAGGFISGLF